MVQTQAAHLIANAKVNLTLSVTGRDEDGYHQLVSAVCFTDFGDALTIMPADENRLSYQGAFARQLEQAGGDTLFAAAADLADSRLLHHITLEKNIPLGGGLGGGSADAAAYLRYLSADWPAAKISALRDASVRLGADVPACFDNMCHIMAGRGEQAHAVSLMTDNHPVMVLTNPLCHADTGAVFGAFAKSGDGISECNPADIAALITKGAWADVMAIGNDLTHAACQLYPQIGQLLDEMAQAGTMIGDDFIAHAMTGSGASCFALLQNRDAAQAYQKSLAEKNIWAKVTDFF